MESPSFTAEESDSERYFLPIRRLKGMVDLVEELIVEVVPGTAGWWTLIAKICVSQG